MSSNSQKTRMQLLRELVRELRQHSSLGPSYFRAAATRAGMTDTDIEVLDLLDTSGALTAGQLAEHTGLTTGAIAGMLNRLEAAGLVARKRDPTDGRRVIVELVPGMADTQVLSPIFASRGQAWEALAAHYTDDQLALLLEFLKRGNVLSGQDIARLRATPTDANGVFSAPSHELERGHLVVAAGSARLTVHTDDMPALYQARFEGAAPDVSAKDGTVTIRYPRRLWLLNTQRAAEVTLSRAIPWRIAIQGGGMEVMADLRRLELAELEVKGGSNMIRIELPTPTGAVPVRISGGASDITIRRPRGVAARVHLKGRASAVVFDDQTFSGVPDNVWVHSPGYDATTGRYDLDVDCSASQLTITAG